MFETKRTVRVTDAIERYADASSLPGSDNSAQLAAYQALVRSAIRHQLTDKQRQAVQLYYYDRYNIYQIADLLGITPSSVSRRLEHARKRIRLFVQAYMECGICRL